MGSYSELIAAASADVFRNPRSPRRRQADIAIDLTAVSMGARVLTRNSRDFAGFPGLEVVGVGAIDVVLFELPPDLLSREKPLRPRAVNRYGADRGQGGADRASRPAGQVPIKT